MVPFLHWPAGTDPCTLIGWAWCSFGGLAFFFLSNVLDPVLEHTQTQKCYAMFWGGNKLIFRLRIMLLSAHLPMLSWMLSFWSKTEKSLVKRTQWTQHSCSLRCLMSWHGQKQRPNCTCIKNSWQDLLNWREWKNICFSWACKLYLLIIFFWSWSNAVCFLILS